MIQIYRHFKAPDPRVPETLDAAASSLELGDERVLLKFDMARAMWPGTLENRISSILRDVPHNDQMPLLVFPEYVHEKKEKSWEIWSSLAVLYISFLPWVYIATYMAVSTRDTTAKQLFIVIAVAFGLTTPPIAMLRKALRARQIARREARLIELQKENGLRLAFEWTVLKSSAKDNSEPSDL